MGDPLDTQLERLFRWFEDNGAPVRPGSRLDLARRAFGDARRAESGMIGPSSPLFRVAQEALRDVQILDVIRAETPKINCGVRKKQMFKVLGKDQDVPRSDERSSRGRDLQLELFVAATLVRGGGERVALEEPDVCMDVAGSRFGVAVKRIKSFLSLEARLSGAIEQVERRRRLGAVLLDVSLAFNKNADPLVLPGTGAEYRDAAEQRMQEIVALLGKELRRAAD